MNTLATPVPALEKIESLAKQYSIARAVVADRASALDAEIRAAQRRKVPGIKTALADAKDAQDALAKVLQESPELFVKPRTITLHGIKVGYQKGKPKLAWENDDRVIALIERNCAPELAELLINVVRTPSKQALSELSPADLRKVGVQIVEPVDSIVISATDSEVDKFVERILKEGAVAAAEESGA